MRRPITALVLLLALPMSVVACLWDTDTPASEARGLPGVVAAITGRFGRNPPLYYELRLKRVAARLRELPGDLAAYDDAGVACDRLGRGDEAIDWMDKKQGQLALSSLPSREIEEQRYRYHANLGTFLVHRWARAGADRENLDEVRAARDHIARAIAINPNAHFGREKYQLQAIDWIIDPPSLQGRVGLPNILGWGLHEDGVRPSPGQADEAVRGLSGLIMLGNAWESVDVFYALEVALQFDSIGFPDNYRGGRNSLAYLALLRCHELIDAGRGSLLPDAATGPEVKRWLPVPGFVESDRELERTYRALRVEADAWQAARLAFMAPRLAEGRHPDTDPSFWVGYREAPAPLLPDEAPINLHHARMAEARKRSRFVAFGAIVLVLGVVALAVKFARSHPPSKADARDADRTA